MLGRLLGRIIINWRRLTRRTKMFMLRSAFKRHGRNFVFDPDGWYSYETIEVGDDVFIGPGATLQASRSAIRIGRKVMFGPNVTIMGGDHNTSSVGCFVYDVTEKLPGNDLPVVIEDDVWIGSGATILKGVTLGRGCIIAAGAVVTKNVPPYCIAGGVPAKVIARRFDVETILTHEAQLYPIEQRLSREQLLTLLEPKN